MSADSDIRWWVRWWIVYFVPNAVKRLRKCRSSHYGPMYDGYQPCLHCGAPWFRKSL